MKFFNILCSLRAEWTRRFHCPCWWKGPWDDVFRPWWCVEEEETCYVSSIQCTQNETGKWRHWVLSAAVHPHVCKLCVHTYIDVSPHVYSYIYVSICTWITSEVKQNGMVRFYACGTCPFETRLHFETDLCGLSHSSVFSWKCTWLHVMYTWLQEWIVTECTTGHVNLHYSRWESFPDKAGHQHTV